MTRADSPLLASLARFATLASIATVATIATLTPTPAPAQTLAVPQSVRATIDKTVAELTPALIATRRDLHQHPELGYRETRTSELVAAKLRALRFDEVRTKIGVTGVVGILKGGKPGTIVAVRADMDALPIPELIDVPYKSTVPNMKHACGHDGHVSMALTVAEVFSRLRAEIPGTVVFIFQPAEEGDPDGGKTGALRMLDDGLLTHLLEPAEGRLDMRRELLSSDRSEGNPTPSAIFGLHVLPQLAAGTIGLRAEGTMASSDRFTIVITGKKTHAAYPHTGIDPMPAAAEVVLGLQTIVSRESNAVEPTVLSVGSIAGGNRYNIIADSVRLEGTARTLRKEGPDFIKSRMDAMLKGITAAFNTTYTLEYKQNAPVTFNDPALTTAIRPALAAIVGEKNVVLPPPQMGAEDFGFYQQKVPGVFFFLGVGNEARHTTAMIHTEYFDLDEDTLPIGARAMSVAVLDYLYRGDASSR